MEGYGSTVGLMNPPDLILDTYERKARLYPALIVLAPAALTVVATIPARLSSLESLVAALAGCGGAFLLSQFARDAGERGQKILFQKWGGLPSVAIFRHGDMRLDSITKARYHETLSKLVLGAKAPSADEERFEPGAADEVYTAWSTYLRARTRDKAKYPLLFAENVNYGYRRNIWGLRSLGILISGSSLAIAASFSFLSYRHNGSIGVTLAGAVAFALVFLLLWIFRFSPDWVRVPADAYAERLGEAIDTLGQNI